MIYFSLFILIIVANLYAASQDANLTAMLTDVMLTVGHAHWGSNL